MVREPDAPMQPPPQDNQLMSKHRVLSSKPQLRLECEARRPERNRTARSSRQLRRFHHVINSDRVFGTHRCLPMVALGLVFERPVFSAMTPVGLVMFAYTAVIGMGVCYLTWFATLRRPVCTENLNASVVVMKSAQDGA